MSAPSISTSRLALVVAVATLLAAGSVATWVHRRAASEVGAQTEEKLTALMQVRSAALLEYLESVREEIRFWNKNRVMRGALREFSAAWNALGPDAESELQRLYIDENPYPVGEKDNLEFASDGSEYSRVHARYHYFLRTFLLHRGVYDVFLFDADGDLVYTSFKEDDYATNLVTGRYKDSDLGRAFREARDNPFPSYVAFFDFAPYAPSHGAPASFFSSPVLADDGTFLGVIAFQIPSARIDDIMQVTAGMGETGETYVVGEDLLMRSDSRFSEASTALETTVNTETVRLALRGESGLRETLDYRGVPVLSAYGPLRFEDATWAVMAEIDSAEALAPIRRIGGAALRSALLASVGAAALAIALAALLARRGGASL